MSAFYLCPNLLSVRVVHDKMGKCRVMGVDTEFRVGMNRISNWSATGYPAALVPDFEFDIRPDIQIYISGWTDINRDDILFFILLGLGMIRISGCLSARF